MEDNLHSYLTSITQQGIIPGVVAYAALKDRCVLRKAYGVKRSEPHPEPMTVETIFDLASLTKLTATWLCVSRLIGEGELSIHDPLECFWGDAAGQYRGVTIGQLLTHQSGLPATLHIDAFGKEKESIARGILSLGQAYEPGTRVMYSDLGFILLGFIVEELAGTALDTFACSLWNAMEMGETMFCPPRNLLARIAPTEWRDHLGDYQWGEVHDSNANWLSGVCGAAGVFSTADDLAKFCSMVQKDGIYQTTQVLDEGWVKGCRENRTKDLNEGRAYGWQILRNCHGEEIIGHTGFTGTAMYIDRFRGITLILLTNRVHPRRAAYAEEMIQVRARARDILWRELA